MNVNQENPYDHDVAEEDVADVMNRIDDALEETDYCPSFLSLGFHTNRLQTY